MAIELIVVHSSLVLIAGQCRYVEAHAADISHRRDMLEPSHVPAADDAQVRTIR